MHHFQDNQRSLFLPYFLTSSAQLKSTGLVTGQNLAYKNPFYMDNIQKKKKFSLTMLVKKHLGFLYLVLTHHVMRREDVTGFVVL